MNILIYGAGVIGSIFAGKLALSGLNVTVLARGRRFEEIARSGIVLVNPNTKRKEMVNVNVIDRLSSEDVYDYIFVVMQRTQVDEVLPILSQNKSKNIVFVVNTALGYANWVKAVGSERLLLGFPSAGGERINGEVSYFIGKGIMRVFQTTTFSNLYGTKAQNVKSMIKIFNKAGIPSVFCRNMDAWQKTHVAMVTSIGNALYKYNSDNYKLANSFSDIKLMVQGMKEGFFVLNSINNKITPLKLNYFKLPVFLLTPIFKVIMGTKLAEITMARHTAGARPEMIYLQEEFDSLIRISGKNTPSIDKLRKNLLSEK